MTFKERYIEKLSSGEFEYVLADPVKHLKFFNELEKDKYYKNEFKGFEENAYIYSEYIQNKADKKRLIPTFIVERKGYPVAMIDLYFKKGNVVEMNSVVRPCMRNQGIKKLIVLDLCEFLYSKGVKKLEFMVSNKNIPNRKALTNIGACITSNQKKEDFAKAYDSDFFEIDPSCIMYRKK